MRAPWVVSRAWACPRAAQSCLRCGGALFDALDLFSSFVVCALSHTTYISLLHCMTVHLRHVTKDAAPREGSAAAARVGHTQEHAFGGRSSAAGLQVALPLHPDWRTCGGAATKGVRELSPAVGSDTLKLRAYARLQAAHLLRIRPHSAGLRGYHRKLSGKLGGDAICGTAQVGGERRWARCAGGQRYSDGGT